MTMRPKQHLLCTMARLLLGLMVLTLGLTRPASAETYPRLSAHAQGIRGDASARKDLRIEALDIAVRIHGTLAVTEVTARFANPGREVLEGDFLLALPRGSVVTGYALDVGGVMIDGVLVDQRRARMAYEARVRAGVDPGLGEIGRDDLFRNRIFPIFAGSGRTIRLRFTSPLNPRAGYVLPLGGGAQVGRLAITISASGVTSFPRVTLPARDGAANGSLEHGLSSQRAEARLDSALEIALSSVASPMLLSDDRGDAFFQINDRSDAATRGREARRVALLWDRSLSRADDDLAKEIALVEAWLRATRPDAIELILFDSGGAERIAISADALPARLRNVRYRGATSMKVLADLRLANLNACVLFSDGLVTIDRREDFDPACPLFTVSSARDADRFWLGALAERKGGEHVDLLAASSAEAVDRLTRAGARVVDVRAVNGERLDYALLDGGANGWRIVGAMPAQGGIVVHLAGIRDGIVERVYARGAGSTAGHEAAASLWASRRIALLAAADDMDREALVAFSRRRSVASPSVSFIVLETAADYARAAIEPPPGFAKAQRLEYDRMRNEILAAEQAAKAGRLQAVLAGWTELQDWWRRKHDPNVRIARSRSASPEASPPPMISPSAPPPPPPPAPISSPPPPQEEAAMAAVDADASNIVVTGSRNDGENRSATTAQAVEEQGRRISIQTTPWTPDRPYLAAIERAAPAQRDAVIDAQARIHGGIPAFWLDLAQWQQRLGRRDAALQSLLSALDLPTRDSQTVSIVADRLLRYGELDRAIFLLERLAADEPDRPQPRRALALALAERARSGEADRRRADLGRAIVLLAEVVMTPWDGAYDGIEMISLVEANRLIPEYRRLGGTEAMLDPRLVALLDVDLRVLIEWNSEASDVDLWVDEPSGERAVYNNPRTRVGGRLSNDMTAGFGPEEYLLRAAPDGTFTIRAHVYAPDRINPNGASIVSATIIRDYGRPTERRERIDLELISGAAAGERIIGRVDFGR